jgi:hypothetical protein
MSVGVVWTVAPARRADTCCTNSSSESANAKNALPIRESEELKRKGILPDCSLACLHLLVPIPWAGHVWALPLLTALAPSERSCHQRHRRYKTLTLWARQLIRLVHRWHPDRRPVVVGDRTYAALELLAAAHPAATVVARSRLDAHLCAPALARLARQTGRPRLVGARLPNLTTYASAPATGWTPPILIECACLTFGSTIS